MGTPEEAAAARTLQPWRYLTGESPELSDDYPELRSGLGLVLGLGLGLGLGFGLGLGLGFGLGLLSSSSEP